jgi:hypothetical protein
MTVPLTLTPNPQPKIVPKITLKSKPNAPSNASAPSNAPAPSNASAPYNAPAPSNASAPSFMSVNIAKTNTKSKIKLKHVSIDTTQAPINLIDADSTDDSSMVSTSSNASVASLDNTYIVPVYGVNMRMSMDNKFIYDLDLNHVGTVLDNKSIEWLD